MIKEKKCKGTHSTTKGLGCGKFTYHRVLGLGKMCGCYSKFLLNTDAGRLRMQKATIKAKKPRLDLEQAEKDYNYSKRLPEALRLAQQAFNKYIRLRDKYKPCISENTAWKPDHDAGHAFSVKQYSELRFDEDNCHGQSILGNRYKEGNFEKYINNLPNRIGQQRFEELLLKAQASKKRTFKWNIEDVNEIKIKYLKKIKELKKQLKSK